MDWLGTRGGGGIIPFCKAQRQFPAAGTKCKGLWYYDLK